MSFMAEFSLRFCCFVFDVNQLKVKLAAHYAIIKKRTTNNFIAYQLVKTTHYFSKAIIMCTFYVIISDFERH